MIGTLAATPVELQTIDAEFATELLETPTMHRVEHTSTPCRHPLVDCRREAGLPPRRGPLFVDRSSKNLQESINPVRAGVGRPVANDSPFGPAASFDLPQGWLSKSPLRTCPLSNRIVSLRKVDTRPQA